MDVMGEALNISQKVLRALGEQEAELSRHQVDELIERACDLAAGFEDKAKQLFPEEITRETLALIQSRVDANISRHCLKIC